MRNSLSVYGLVMLSVSLTILCVFLIFNIRSERKKDIQNSIHSHQVIEQVLELQSLIKDVESSQKDYLITRNHTYLKLYEKAIRSVPVKLDSVKKLTSGNDQQQQTIRLLANQIRNTISELTHTLSLYQNGGLKSVSKEINTDKERVALDSIHAITNRILSLEKTQWTSYTKKGNFNFLVSGLISYSCLLSVGLLSVIVLLTMHWKQQKNLKQIYELGKQNKLLHTQVQNHSKLLEDTNSKLVTVNEDRNKFLGMAAHDLKSPINTIKGLVGILTTISANSTNEQKEILEHITKSTSKMSKLISDLLDINKIDLGANEVYLEKTDVFELTESVVFSFKESAKKKDISINLFNLLAKAELMTDKSLLVRILENLISNALKFSQKGKHVFISLSNENGQFVISVRDQGPGIPEEELPLLFGKFQKLSNRPTEGENSTGLGLSIVKSLVDSLKGTIECKSQVNVGTIFTLRF